MKTRSMIYQHKLFKTFTGSSISTVLLSALLCCLLLLSGCSLTGNGTTTSNATKTSNTAPSTPTVNITLKNQGDTQLKTFQQWIDLMQKYGGDTTSYQQQYNSDKQAVEAAKTDAAYQSALTTLHTHITAIQLPAMKVEAQNLQQQLEQKVTSWGQQHQYHDDYNNTSYSLGYEYGPNGIGGWVQDDLATAKSVADYQQAIENINMYLDNFQAMTTNSNDKTPYDQPHKTDLDLMQHYGKNGKVLVISLEEQAMRVYDQGKLVKAFLVTTGRPNKPSIPGVWWIEGKESPTTFKAGVPKSSPDYYPDTPINYAMQYHSNGYFIHDSWWRANYGPGTNYPHADDSGDPFSSQGSHGCVNLSKDDAGWLYNFVQLYTSIIMY